MIIICSLSYAEVFTECFVFRQFLVGAENEFQNCDLASTRTALVANISEDNVIKMEIYQFGCTMRNIIEIQEIRESNYEISKFVHTLLQKDHKRVQHLEFHQNCVRTLAFTDFLNSCPIISNSLRKLCKSGKVFIVVQLRTFCTSIQELVMFLVNSNFFVNICRFV